MKLADVNSNSIKKISKQELLNMHNRTHQLYSLAINKSSKNKEYINMLVSKHDLLANEIIRRGMNHNSPLSMMEQHSPLPPPIRKKKEEEDLNELTYFISPKAKRILRDVPTVTKKEFLNRVEKGDIIVAFSPKKVMKKYVGSIIGAKLMSSIQGTPYTSSKIVYNNELAIGYGVTERPISVPDTVETYPLKSVLRERNELCLIRLNATSSQKEKAINFMKSKLGLSYSNSDLYKSIWDRFTNRKILPFFKDEPLDPNQLKTIQKPLFCSSIIAIAYVIAGYKLGFNNKNPYDVWPRDFLIDDNTQKICRVEYEYS